MHKKVGHLCLFDEVVLLGHVWKVLSIRRQYDPRDENNIVKLSLRHSQRNIDQELIAFMWDDIKVKEGADDGE